MPCILGAFDKQLLLRHVCLSVRLSAWNSSIPTGRISTKSGIENLFFLENLSRKFISPKSDENNGDFTRRPLYIYGVLSNYS